MHALFSQTLGVEHTPLEQTIDEQQSLEPVQELPEEPHDAWQVFVEPALYPRQ